MGLQLKEQDENEEFHMRGTRSDNPWDTNASFSEFDVPYQMPKDTKTVAMQKMEEHGQGFFHDILQWVYILVVAGVIILVGKLIVTKLLPRGEDITQLLGRDDSVIASELKVSFQDDPESVRKIHQYSKGIVTVKSADEISIVYIDGRQAGVHVEGMDYTMFDVQVGDSEKHAYDNMSYPYDDFLSVIDDMAEGKTTTYFYYSEKRNDCLALTVNDTTNRIVAMTYFRNYAKVTETLDKF